MWQWQDASRLEPEQHSMEHPTFQLVLWEPHLHVRRARLLIGLPRDQGAASDLLPHSMDHKSSRRSASKNTRTFRITQMTGGNNQKKGWYDTGTNFFSFLCTLCGTSHGQDIVCDRTTGQGRPRPCQLLHSLWNPASLRSEWWRHPCADKAGRRERC